MGWIPKRTTPQARPPGGLNLVGSATQVAPKSVAPIPEGPGDALKSALQSIGVWSRTNCRCDRHVKAMNNNGLGWCFDHVDLIVSWLREGAAERKLPFEPWLASRFVLLALHRYRKRRIKAGLPTT